MTDNGSVFTSLKFQDFAKFNGIRHVKSAPYHPASNGLAERAVQTFKEHMKRNSNDSMDTRLARFLFRYRITPHTTTGVAPAQLLMGRLPRSHLLKPDVATRVQQSQKTSHDLHTKARSFRVGDLVFVCDFPSGTLWLPGRVVKVNGPLSYLIELQDGRTVRCHVDHVRSRTVDTSVLPSGGSDDMLDIPVPSSEPVQVNPPVYEPVLRRSTRVSQPPDQFSS